MINKSKIYRYSTNCHVIEFQPDDTTRLDVSLGRYGVLERLSTMNGEPKSNEDTVVKMNGSFFAMSGSGGDTYSTFVDEGKFYHLSAPFYPTLVYWKATDRFTIEHNPPQNRLAEYQEKAHWAIGGAWTLIVDGKINFTYDKETLIAVFGHPYSPNPRTMIGQKNDKTIVMVVTDGRVSGSRGLTITEQAEIMLDLGCVTAMNFDGGGSSELIMNDKIINRLASGVERAIGTAFMVYEKKDISPPEIPSETYATGIVKVRTSLNVRSGPSTSTTTVGKLYNGDLVKILAPAENKWYKINYNGDVAYVYAQYVTITENPEVDIYQNFAITTVNLNLRLEPSTYGHVFYTIPKGTNVKMGNVVDGWAPVKHGNYTGYCYARYLKPLT